MFGLIFYVVYLVIWFFIVLGASYLSSVLSILIVTVPFLAVLIFWLSAILALRNSGPSKVTRLQNR